MQQTYFSNICHVELVKILVLCSLAAAAYYVLVNYADSINTLPVLNYLGKKGLGWPYAIYTFCAKHSGLTSLWQSQLFSLTAICCSSQEQHQLAGLTDGEIEVHVLGNGREIAVPTLSSCTLQSLLHSWHLVF